MALFKIFKGNDISKLNNPSVEGYMTPTDGYAYYNTNNQEFYIDADYAGDGTITRKPINAHYAYSAGYDGASNPQKIDTTYIKEITISGNQLSYTKGDGSSQVVSGTLGAVTGVKGSNESSYRTGNVNITAANIGLSNVENKSSATIRGELTSKNITDALTFTPYNATNPNGYTSNTGTVTSVSGTDGLTGNVTTTGSLSHAVPTGAEATTLGNSTTRYYIKTITTDKFGHVTGVTTGNETVTNTNTTYTFEDGVGGFSVTPSNGTKQTISIGKPATAGTADAVAWSGITDKPSSYTPSSHTHGNIQDSGTLQTNDITIASGDKLIVTDSSNSNKIARTSISFDGSTTSKALTQKGTWETFLQSHQSLSAYAKLASPALTGTPTAPTAAAGTNTTQIATTAFVMNAFTTNDAMIFKGVLGTDTGMISSLPPNNIDSSYKQGWTYKVGTAGTYAGQDCEIGDTIYCIADGTTANNANWTIIQTNIDGTVIGPSESAGGVAVFTGTTGKAIKDSGFTIATSVPENAVFTDTTYTFDGTYNASTNKAATVSTVTNAINALDGNLNSTTAGSGKTLTAFSQTNGVVSATFGNISITKSQVSDFPTSMPASDVSAWAKASSKPSYSLSEITGASDVQAIEALTGTSGLLKKTAANIWTLDTTTYTTNTGTVTSITLKAGSGIKLDTDNTAITTSGTRTISHTNSVTAQTTQAVYPIKIDAQGHISSYGTAITSMTPTSHTHGNITNDGKIGSTADYAVYTTTNGSVTAGSLAVSAPTASGTATAFISSVSQNSKGQISASKANLPTASDSVAGITTVGASGGAAAYVHTHTITANATDGIFNITGTNGTNAVTYAIAPYSSQQSKQSFDTSTANPTRTDRLNYNGYLYATKLYSDGEEVLTSHQTVENKEAEPSWGDTFTIATIGETNITMTLPSLPEYKGAGTWE